ncbi:helix-turn-helix domain-containing protein [Hafnia alvei]|uniref:helix-turn-helix domain-containing protein n=1 Tax=Hafnia alvei TaxID=569 RepID=UPI00103311BB|nr:helix-turn-helix domain-containing protein [Hafnia alvei]TBL40719.1 helix-turn-helix domain-containing protein [Hafnia alvei]
MAKNINPEQIERLKQLVELVGVKKVELSKIAEVSPQAVNNWFKTGLISKDSANKLASELGVSIDWLLYGDSKEPLNRQSLRRKQLESWFATRVAPDNERERKLIKKLISGESAFGSLLARRLESDYGMPHMYLDAISEAAPETPAVELTDQERELLLYFQQFPDSTKQAMVEQFKEKAATFDNLFKELSKLRSK